MTESLRSNLIVTLPECGYHAVGDAKIALHGGETDAQTFGNCTLGHPFYAMLAEYSRRSRTCGIQGMKNRGERIAPDRNAFGRCHGSRVAGGMHVCPGFASRVCLATRAIAVDHHAVCCAIEVGQRRGDRAAGASGLGHSEPDFVKNVFGRVARTTCGKETQKRPAVGEENGLKACRSGNRFGYRQGKAAFVCRIVRYSESIPRGQQGDLRSRTALLRSL